MSQYRRTYSGLNNSYGTLTTVTIQWSMKSSAYAIKFSDTRNWNEMQVLIAILKSVPYGEYDYDPDNKIWFLVEKHLDKFKTAVEMLPKYFTVVFEPKPVGQSYQGQFVSVDVYLDKFKILTDIDLRTLQYEQAKKIYRQMCMKYHPDRNNGDNTQMSDINECWSQIEKLHYKQKKEPEYVS